MVADCMACQNGQSKEEYCASRPATDTTPGCATLSPGGGAVSLDDGRVCVPEKCTGSWVVNKATLFTKCPSGRCTQEYCCIEDTFIAIHACYPDTVKCDTTMGSVFDMAKYGKECRWEGKMSCSAFCCTTPVTPTYAPTCLPGVQSCTQSMCPRGSTVNVNSDGTNLQCFESGTLSPSNANACTPEYCCNSVKRCEDVHPTLCHSSTGFVPNMTTVHEICGGQVIGIGTSTPTMSVCTVEQCCMLEHAPSRAPTTKAPTTEGLPTCETYPTWMCPDWTIFSPTVQCAADPCTQDECCVATIQPTQAPTSCDCCDTCGPSNPLNLLCTNGTEQVDPSGNVIDPRIACPNLLFLNDNRVGVQNYAQWGVAIFNALKAYIDATLFTEDACNGVPHGATLVDNIANLPSDLSPYTQVWVYDLNSDPEDAANHAKWQSIAHWFDADPATRHEIILDGRIISSAHGVGASSPNHWQIFYNYFENLRKRGGGLVLGACGATENCTTPPPRALLRCLARPSRVPPPPPPL